MAWSRRKSFISVAIGLAAVGMLVVMSQIQKEQPAAQRGKLTLENIPFNGERAYKHLENLCAIGPRISGSKGMEEQQELLTKHFEKLGAKVIPQEFFIRHPESGERTRIANLIVEFHPERQERVLFCAHYDTRPYPDEDPDPRKRREPFLGANDGASGVAVLMELATHMKDFAGPLGIDFVLFDAEELVYDRNRDRFFLGSEYFAGEYVRNPSPHKYRCGVLLDMVGDKELQIYQEKNSVYIRAARPITQGIWATAAKLGVSEFIPRTRHDVKDDHLALNNIAHIPTCDIIDFDYPRPGPVNYWHTTQDIPENCSALSLAKVGWVIHEWAKGLK